MDYPNGKMINVQSYHDKLDKLQTYMNLFIDRKNYLWLDMDCLPVMSPKEIMRLFNKTGVLISNGVPAAPPPKFITFKEYCDENRN
jgi:hypothetical protein